MAGHVVAPSSFINLEILKDHARKRLNVPGSKRLRTTQRKSRGSCNISRPSTRRSYKLAAPSLLNEKAGFRELSRFTCLASFADLNGIAAFEWVPLGDQVLLMASIFLTYMAGVIPVQKSNYTPQKNISEKNLDIGRPASAGSEKGNDFKGDLNGAWNVVKGKILESIDAIESGSTPREGVGNPEKSQGKEPLSLYAISERPKLWLLWACFQQLEEEANSSVSDPASSDNWITSFPGIIQRLCKPACVAWLQQEFHQENNSSSETISSLMIQKLNEEETIMQKIRKSGKEDLYAEFLYFLKFGTHRKPGCYDPGLFQLHGISLLEDLVITIADGIAGTYLELISVDGNLSSETPTRAIDICNLSSRELQKLRNEVALYQWLYQNLEAVVSMYEDRFDLYTFESQVVAKSYSDKPANGSWWKKLTMGKPEAVESLRYAIISHFSMPVKRTRELRALTGWRYYFSLFLELSDIGMPIVRVVVDKISGAISFFLVSLIGRSVGLIYTGIRQSLRWK